MAAGEAQYQVFVVELTDEVGPRRRLDRPNVHVGVTSQDPSVRVDQLQRGAKRRDWMAGHVAALRPDLTVNFGPTTENEARRQQRKLRRKLRRQGYTVDRDLTVWRTYVIELDGSQRDEVGEGWVYVGQTSKTPEERFVEHTTGKRNGRGRLYSGVVFRHGVRLRPDLVVPDPVLCSKEDALAAEQRLARRLTRLGYRVEGDGAPKALRSTRTVS